MKTSEVRRHCTATVENLMQDRKNLNKYDLILGHFLLALYVIKLMPGDDTFLLNYEIVRKSLLFKLEELKWKLGIGADGKFSSMAETDDKFGQLMC